MKKSKKNSLAAAGMILVLLLAGVIFFFTYYQVDEVQVMGSSHYSEKQIKKMVLRGPLASNSVLAPLLYTKQNTKDVPFVDGYTVTRLNRHTICVSVKEKDIVGCIPYLDSYIYFDRNGVFVEGSTERNEKIPFFDGIKVKKVILNEKLPIKDETVMNTAVALSTIFSKNDKVPDHIEFGDDGQISLVYGDITVKLGKDEYLEDKMTRVLAILSLISGKKGILHAENVNDNSKTITLEQEQDENQNSEETWTGGYDEEGNYTGEGEYDENGNYVGPKPQTDLEYAQANWVGGYDEEGDYTGSGEYDANMNYVGEAPTEESMAANGNWKGGYREDGEILTEKGLEFNPKKTKVFSIADGFTFLGFKYRLTDTGKVIMIIDPKNVKERRRILRRLVRKAKQGELTKAKVDECYYAWRNHASKGNSFKLLQRMDKYYKSLWR